MNLKEIRKKHNYTLKYVTDYLSISKTFAIQLENGKNNLTIKNAIALADLYNIDIDELVARDPNNIIYKQNFSSLVELRKFNKLTQKEVGQHLGVCESEICKIETNNNGLTLNMAIGMADLYKVPLKQIIKLIELNKIKK